MLANSEGRIFVAQRIDNPGPAWQMPQGGIDEGEDIEVAALRELEEEIGTARAEIVARSVDWMTYELPDELRRTLWKGRYRGQAQKWFLLRFTGTDADIDIATEHPEFSSWRWADPEELPELAVPFKRDIYERVLAEFRPFLRAIAAKADWR